MKDPNLDAPVPGVFPRELNKQWNQLLWRFDYWLTPVWPTLRLALPLPDNVRAQSVEDEKAKERKMLEQAAHQLAAAQSNKPLKGKGGDKKGGDKKGDDGEEAVGPTTRVVLLLDPELASLPFESLPHLRSTCVQVSRATSLAALKAGMLVGGCACACVRLCE